MFEALRESAAELLPRLTLERLRATVDRRLTGSIALGGDPTRPSAAEAIRPSLEGSLERLRQIGDDLIQSAELDELAGQVEQELTSALESDAWVSAFPGRLILKRFVARSRAQGVSYEGFRNLVIDKMVEDSFEPPEMRAVLMQIERDSLVRVSGDE